MNAPLSRAAVLDHITIELGGATLTIPTRAVAKALLERMLAGAVQATVGVPGIGDEWPGQGGIYAGAIRGVDGAPDQHVIVAQADPSAMEWLPAIDWAKGLMQEGHQDFTLPTRKEQALLFANVSELFKAEYYWSCEQHAEFPDYAWGAYFSNGNQYYDRKGTEYRARAVRRVPIQ